MSNHFHPFPLNSNTSLFMHIQIKSFPTSPTSKHKNMPCYFHTKTSSDKRFFVATKKPAMRRNKIVDTHAKEIEKKTPLQMKMEH